MMELNIFDENNQPCLKIIFPNAFDRTSNVVFDVK